MSIFLYIVGSLLVISALVDAIWTTFWVDGGSGPVTTRVTTWLWRGWRRLVSERRHRLLSLAGPLILIATATTWLLLLWTGWTLLFAADEQALSHTRDQTPPDWSGRIWYIGYMIFTVGNGDFTPKGGLWQLLSALMGATGLTIATLAITYLLSVVSAVVQKRSFASHVIGLGRSPEQFVIGAWTGQGFGALEIQLNGFVTQLGGLTQQHLAYPVLHYYHSAQAQDATAVAVVVLDEALALMEHGLPEHAQPDAAVLRAARSTLQSYLNTLAEAFISPAKQTPPPPDIQKLREAGLPVVSDEQFQGALRELARRRRLLLGMVQNDARQWPSV